MGESAGCAAVDAILTVSRPPIRVTPRSLGVAPSTAGRMCDRLARKGLIRRHRARADRRAVLVAVTVAVTAAVTAAGRVVVEQATARRRAVIEEARPPVPAHSGRAGETARA